MFQSNRRSVLYGKIKGINTIYKKLNSLKLNRAFLCERIILLIELSHSWTLKIFTYHCFLEGVLCIILDELFCQRSMNLCF